LNIARNLEYAALHFPERPAVIEGEREITYAQFNQDTNRVATGLTHLGVSPGDYVALCGPNSYEWLTLYYGTLKAGAVAVTLSALVTGAELDRLLSDARPRLLYTVDDRLNDLKDRGRHPALDRVIADRGDLSPAKLREMGTRAFRALDRDRSETAAVLYTGGTTGSPKGVMLTHENLMTSIHNVAHHERSTPDDRALCFLPLNHVFAQVHIVNATIYSAGSLVLQSSFDLESALDTIQRRRVTKFYAVPTIYIRLLALPDLEQRLKSLRYSFSAAASMAAELVREWKGRMNLDIHEAYGMTESASMVTYNHYHRHVIGSVGTPVNTVEVEIRDPEGNRCPVDTEGEICIRGPNIMKGYLNKPEETEAAFWSEWFRSGDVGLMDENRYLYIVDRLKDMIITGGENVYPREIEEVLYTRPEVQECAVIGLPDREYGERVTALIILKEGQSLDPDSLKAFLKTQLSRYKVPKTFIPVSEFPKSSAGKILKRELKKRLLGQEAPGDQS
jgi:long-chain acyl-CoA synthetase